MMTSTDQKFNWIFTALKLEIERQVLQELFSWQVDIYIDFKVETNKLGYVHASKILKCENLATERITCSKQFFKKNEKVKK